MRYAVVFGALSGLVAVLLSAWAAHGLKATLGPEDLGRIAVGARLQIWHALALLAVGALAAARPGRALDVATWGFALGTLLFSGGLYLKAFTGLAFATYAAPLGGVLFFAGWLALAWHGLKAHVHGPR